MNRQGLRDIIVASNGNRDAYRALLEAHFKTADGLADLADAPRVMHGDQQRPMTASDAVTSLLEEYPTP